MPLRTWIALLLCFLLSAGCTSSRVTQDRADRLRGGPLSNFGGSDGADPEAQAVARAICEGREYDFTPSGFQLAEGAAYTTTAAADPRWPGGSGSIDFLDPPDNLLVHVVLNLDPGVPPSAGTPVLNATFSRLQAQDTINTPGQRFTLNWRITYTQDSVARSITADQTLSGVAWVSLR